MSPEPFSPPIQPTPSEAEQRAAVLTEILGCIESGERIMLPDWDRSVPVQAEDYALLNVGLEPNRFGGWVGPFRYQFEGEDDLLHLMICRRDGGSLTPMEAQTVVSWLLAGVPSGLYWVKPATRSQHFYVGHDVLPGSLIV
ncbi:MAG: hypothetical protein MH204_09885 [Fimbriimonadaceae bacterium]|nr:hypothetical protein [Fimbriimonadaceae bacterium]